jgi:hypothetical protein
MYLVFTGYLVQINERAILTEILEEWSRVPINFTPLKMNFG